MTRSFTDLASGTLKKQYAVRWEPGQVHLDGKAREAEKVSLPAEGTSHSAGKVKSQEILVALAV